MFNIELIPAKKKCGQKFIPSTANLYSETTVRLKKNVIYTYQLQVKLRKEINRIGGLSCFCFSSHKVSHRIIGGFFSTFIYQGLGQNIARFLQCKFSHLLNCLYNKLLALVLSAVICQNVSKHSSSAI